MAKKPVVKKSKSKGKLRQEDRLTRGNPVVCVRLAREVLAMIDDVLGEDVASRGRRSGRAKWIRDLVMKSLTRDSDLLPE